MDEILALRKLFNKELLSSIHKGLATGGMMGLTDTIFYICFTIGLFQCFQKIGTKSFADTMVKFSLKVWLCLALVYGGSYIDQFSPPALKNITKGSSQPLYLTFYDRVYEFANDLTDQMSEGGAADESMLAYNTQNLMDFQDNLILALYHCKETDAPCLRSYLYTGQAPDVKPSASTAVPAEQKGLIESTYEGAKNIATMAVKNHPLFKGLQAVVALVDKYVELSIRFYANPGIVIFPILQWALGLASALLNFALALFWGISIAVGVLLTQVLTPFMILPQFTNNVKSMYKTFFSTAFYGFSLKLIIWISNIMMTGLVDTTQSLMIPKIISAAENTSTMPGMGAIGALMMSNFMCALAIVGIQLVAMKNVPKFSKSIFGLSLSSIVQIGETVFDAGMSFAKMMSKAAIVVAGTVATAGAGAVVASGAMAASSAAAAGAAKVAGGVAKGVASSVGKMAGSKIAGAATKVGSSVSKMGGSPKSVFGKMAGKAGQGITNSGNSVGKAVQKAGTKTGQMAEKAGNKTARGIKKTESVLKDHFTSDEDKAKKKAADKAQEKEKDKKDGKFKTAEERLEAHKAKKEGRAPAGSGDGDDKEDKKSNKDGMLKSFAKRNAKKFKPMKMLEAAHDSAFDSAQAGGKSVFGEAGSNPAANMMSKVTSAGTDIDFKGDAKKDGSSSSDGAAAASSEAGRPKEVGGSSSDKLAQTEALEKNKDRTAMTEEDTAKYTDINDKINMGTATPEEMAEFRKMGNSMELNEDQKKSFDDISEKNQTFKDLNEEANEENDMLVNNIKEDEELNDKNAQELLDKVGKGEISKDVLKDPAISKSLEEYKAKEVAKSAKFVEEMNKKMDKQQAASKEEKIELAKLYKSQQFKSSADEETIEKLKTAIERLKKENEED